MAEGIRIHHPNPEVWGCTVLVPHPGFNATATRRERKAKDYYLRLDSEGNVIVSTTIWQRLQEARESGFSPHPFIILNTVAEPPTQGITQGSTDQRRIFRQEQEALRELAPKGIKPRVVRMPQKPNKRFTPPKQLPR